jgi:predicted transcriptional regulator
MNRTGIHKAIWLHICHEGGAWTPDEIAEEFGMDRQKANVLMQNMVARQGSLKRFKVEGRSAFGVTKECAIPAGLTVADLRTAGAMESGRLPAGMVNSVFQMGSSA